MSEKGKIDGYREKSPAQLEAINTIKANEKNLAALWAAVHEADTLPQDAYYTVDHELMRQAREHFTVGYMLMVRAVSNPTDPYVDAVLSTE